MGLFDLFSNKAAENAAAKANAGLQQGYNDLSAQYGLGRDALRSGYGSAEGVFNDVLGAYKPGAAAYGDVTGANGIEGLQRGTDLYKNSGQYGVFGVANDAAQQAIQRARGAGGALASGGTDYGAAKTASDLASTNWGQFVSGLQPYLSNYGTAASNLGNAYVGEGTALNTSFTGQGNAANTTQTAEGANLAGAEMNKYKVGANILNAGLGVASLAAGLPPGTFSSLAPSTSTGANSYGAATSPYGSNPFTGDPNNPRNNAAYPTGGGSLFSAFS